MEYGAEVAQVTVRLADGSTIVKPLVYGFDLRASDDPNPTAAPRSAALSAVSIEVGGALVKSVEFHRSDTAAGLRVHGITLI
jgi:hypothetical protein